MSGPGDSASASVFVAVPPDEAFRVFTDEIDAWWRHGLRFRLGGKRAGRISFEGKTGGRLFQNYQSKGELRSFEVGKVLAWEPPHTLSLEWRISNFAPEEKTFVDVSFVASGTGTMVTVRHRGWSALRDDHPARHGLTGAEFARSIGMWWGDLMRSLREYTLPEEPQPAVPNSKSGSGVSEE